jgi:four helix bundle protein
VGRFRQLKVWQRSKDLAVFVYTITDRGRMSRDYGLKDQMRRAAISISSNIAEGDELGSDRQSVHYFHIARGSSAELITQAIIAHEIGYFTEDGYKHIFNECTSISSMLTKLIISRKEKSSGIERI